MHPEVQRLGTTNQPGYGELLFDPRAPRIKRKNLDAAKQSLYSDLSKFDDNCRGLIELTEPGIDPGREADVVNQYVHLERLLKELVDLAADLVEMMEEAGVTHEVAEVREGVGRRQRWLTQKHDEIGIAAMTKSRADNISLNSQSQASLTSVQRRLGGIARKKVSISFNGRKAEGEIQVAEEQIRLKRVQVHLERLKEQEELEALQAEENCNCTLEIEQTDTHRPNGSNRAVGPHRSNVQLMNCFPNRNSDRCH